MLDDVDQLIALLAQASGVERARAIVEEACGEAGVPFPPSVVGTRAVVQRLAGRSGAVGAAVRLAQRRAATRAPDGAAAWPVAAPVRRDPTPTDETKTAEPPPPSVVALLSPALGETQAAEVVHDVASRLGLDARALSARDAARVLDVLAARSDYVATVARFAKAKAMLDPRG
jgi:hypothetical protein